MSPVWPKPKDEGWIIALGHVESQELWALKRVGYVKGKLTASLAIVTPDTAGNVIGWSWFSKLSFVSFFFILNLNEKTGSCCYWEMIRKRLHFYNSFSYSLQFIVVFLKSNTPKIILKLNLLHIIT